MIINTKLNDDDKKELEYMLSLDYVTPYGSKTKKN